MAAESTLAEPLRHAAGRKPKASVSPGSTGQRQDDRDDVTLVVRSRGIPIPPTPAFRIN